MKYKVEGVTPYANNKSKRGQIIEMFDNIAPKYDKLNGILSMGVDNYWRRDAIKELKKYAPKSIIDIATGTGDFALLANSVLKPEKIVGVDISKG